MKKRELLKTAALYTATVALAIPAGRLAATTFERLRSHGQNGDFSRHLRGTRQLTLYGTSTCPYCRAARKFLTEAKVDFADVQLDIDRSAEKLFAELNATSVPVLVSRHHLVVGFHIDEYRATIEESGTKGA